jgi:hypothetical protein
VFAASHNSKCIVGLRLGLLGLYKAAALIATEGFAWKFGFFGDVGMLGVVRDHDGFATSMAEG